MTSKMTDSERRKLIDKLNKETEEFIQEKKKKNQGYKYEDCLTDENIDEYLATHPAFLKSQPTAEEIENNPLLKGLQQIQYDPDDTPYEQAIAHKKDGNFYFKVKKYKLACVAYTEAIRAKCDDVELLNILYTNRAAANYHLENYRSSLLDASYAVKLSPHRVKSLLRCAQCCLALKRYDDAINWCNVIISLEDDHKIAKEIQAKCLKEKKVQDRNYRKMMLQQEKENKKQQDLLDAVKSRKINFKELEITLHFEDPNADVLDATLSKGLKKVYLDDDKFLVWPVLLLYPEYETTDFIEAFHEHSTFSNMLQLVFSEQPEWDVNKHYIPSQLLVCYENTEEQALYEVPLNITLGEILSHPSYVVQASTPNFFVISKLSNFVESFRLKWKTICKR